MHWLMLLYRIISFIGLGIDFAIGSFLFNYDSKLLFAEEERK